MKMWDPVSMAKFSMPWDTKLPMCGSFEKREILIDRLNDESPIEPTDAILEKIGLDHNEVKQYWNYF